MMDFIEKESEKMEKWVILTFIVISAFSIYGIYNLITKLL